MKSKLKCSVGALGKSSRADGLCWPGAGSPELPLCHLPHSKGQGAAHLLFLGSSSVWCSPDASDSQSVQQENLPTCNESRLSEMNQFCNVDKKAMYICKVGPI